MRTSLADQVDNAAMIPINGYVVFSDPRVTLSLDDTNLPVVRAEDLKDKLRKSKRGAALSPATHEQLEKVLNDTANAKTAK